MYSVIFTMSCCATPMYTSLYSVQYCTDTVQYSSVNSSKQQLIVREHRTLGVS